MNKARAGLRYFADDFKVIKCFFCDGDIQLDLLESEYVDEDESSPLYLHCNHCGKNYEPLTKIELTFSLISNKLELCLKVERLRKIYFGQKYPKLKEREA